MLRSCSTAAPYASALDAAKAVTIKVMSSSAYVRRGSKWLGALYQETPVP
jgi:hypothetical protein